MMATLPLPLEQLARLLAEDLAAGEVVDAVVRDALRLRRVGVPGTTGMPASIALLMVSVRKSPLSAEMAMPSTFWVMNGLEDLLLLQLVGGRRRVPDDVDVAELLRLPLGAHLRVVEDRDVQRLRDHREPQPCGACRRRFLRPPHPDTTRRQAESDRQSQVSSCDAQSTPFPRAAVDPSTTITMTTKPTISRS